MCFIIFVFDKNGYQGDVIRSNTVYYLPYIGTVRNPIQRTVSQHIVALSFPLHSVTPNYSIIIGEKTYIKGDDAPFDSTD